MGAWITKSLIKQVGFVGIRFFKKKDKMLVKFALVIRCGYIENVTAKSSCPLSRFPSLFCRRAH